MFTSQNEVLKNTEEQLDLPAKSKEHDARHKTQEARKQASKKARHQESKKQEINKSRKQGSKNARKQESRKQERRKERFMVDESMTILKPKFLPQM